MDLLKKTLELSKIYEIKPARSRGQNFLIEEKFYNKIIEVSDLKEDDLVLEVGPGLGFLTAKLAKAARKVIAVELDDKLAEVLKTGLKAQGIKNVEVINEDVLRIKVDNLFRHSRAGGNLEKGNSRILNPSQEDDNKASYKIVANLPYNITSHFLRKFLSEEPKPEAMVLMLQKEVAERISAKAGEMSLLAVSVQFYAIPKIITTVPASAFWPKPEVDSAIIRLDIKDSLRPRGDKFEKEFFRLVRIGFSSRRKMLKNNLANGYHVAPGQIEQWLLNAGLNLKIRAQELTVEEWLKLLEVIPAIML